MGKRKRDDWDAMPEKGEHKGSEWRRRVWGKVGTRQSDRTPKKISLAFKIVFSMFIEGDFKSSLHQTNVCVNAMRVAVSCVGIWVAAVKRTVSSVWGKL